MNWKGVVLVVAGILLLMGGIVALEWWALGQFFSGSQRWAAFWLFNLMTTAIGSTRR